MRWNKLFHRTINRRLIDKSGSVDILASSAPASLPAIAGRTAASGMGRFKSRLLSLPSAT